MTASVWIVRHGDTFLPGEAPRRIGARSDPPLAPSGFAQARSLGALFRERGVTFARVRCSPQRRTRETATTLLGEAGPRPRPAAWLREIDHGPDEDMPEPAVVARIGRAALDAWDREAAPPPGWIIDAERRRAGWRRFLRGPGAAGDSLLVTSNGAARFAFLAEPALGEAARALTSLKLRTGAWGRLVRGAGGWRITEWDERP